MIPVLALANSGVAVPGLGGAAFLEPLALGAAAGLLVGKPVGIFAFSSLAVRLGVAPMPRGGTRAALAGVSVVAGIGFTVAIPIAALAFPGSASGVAGFVWLVRPPPADGTA